MTKLMKMAERVRTAERFIDENTETLPNGDETFVLCKCCDTVDGHASDDCEVALAQNWLDSLE